MDPSFGEPLNFSNGFQVTNQSTMVEIPGRKLGVSHGIEIPNPDQKQVKVYETRASSFFETIPCPNSSFSHDCAEDLDFSDAVLRYIDSMLMEEEMEDKTHMLQESLDFQAKEKSFYDVLGKKYPPSPNPGPPLINEPAFYSTTSSSVGSGYLIDIVDPSWINSHNELCDDSLVRFQKGRQISNVMEGFSDSPISPLQMRDVLSNESQSVWNFNKGIEEANKFLPRGNNLLIRDNVYRFSPQEEFKTELRGKKNCHNLDIDAEEERSSKLLAVANESDAPMEEFDDVLLHALGETQKKFAAYRDDLRKLASKSTKQNGKITGATGGKGRGKKQGRKKEVIDLRTLLVTCAQAVAADDRRNASELLKQIRRHSSPYGDGSQRLAHYFADGLEARLAGTGSQLHKAIVNKRTTAADFLKAYYTYLASSPFRKISNFASNKTVNMKSVKAAKVHVIDFGILYGFQWPTFIQKISERKGGPPKVRITGIDFPQPGFKPAERIEETGRRLAHYAKTFNVPFEYNAIAQNWDSIRIEDLKIEKGEYVVVTCLYRMKNLLDETVIAESSRTKVLNLIRKMNPDIFIHGIVNGAYSAPFFVTRFREVLFHFSAMFDMLETNIPREKPERMLIERDIFGKEALNVIACEGWERVERPETYKQWQVRNMRAGFVQIPMEREIVEKAEFKVRTFYHKDFVIDEDRQWLLMGWKGRIIYAISCWKPL